MYTTEIAKEMLASVHGEKELRETLRHVARWNHFLQMAWHDPRNNHPRAPNGPKLPRESQL